QVRAGLPFRLSFVYFLVTGLSFSMSMSDSGACVSNYYWRDHETSPNETDLHAPHRSVLGERGRRLGAGPSDTQLPGLWYHQAAARQSNPLSSILQRRPSPGGGRRERPRTALESQDRRDGPRAQRAVGPRHELLPQRRDASVRRLSKSHQVVELQT